MKRNIILGSDSYKASHHFDGGSLYPPKTTNMYSYLESRGGKYGSTIFFGLQYLLKEYFEGSVVTHEDVNEAESFWKAHGEPFAKEAWTTLVDRHNGRLPIRIKAVKEGLCVPTHNILLSVESTDPDFFWLPSYLETQIVRSIWYPTTVCTTSHYIKRTIKQYLDATANDTKSEIGFKLHDFGARGVSSSESAGIGGMAHLVNFMGSDTVEGVRYAQHYYGVDSGMPAYSIAATEHSTITSWGKENELNAYRNVVKQFAKPGALFACVSDSYDLYNVLENVWGGELRDEVANSGATLVVRPDSGNPAEVVLKTMQTLERKVGTETNLRGYKVLPKWIRVIQGDGINHESIEEILLTLKNHDYSASNIAFGMGGALLQQVNRDTQRFAYKCSEATIDGKAVPVFKDPATDPGKRSKSGRLKLISRNGMLQTVQETDSSADLLETVFENGELKRTQTLDEVRKLADSAL